MNNENLGKKLKELRILKGYTQQELAELVGVDEKHISRLENGKYFPKFKTLNNLVNVLEANINDFIGIKFEDIKVNLNPIYIKALQILNEAKNDDELNCYLDALKVIQKTLKFKS